MRGVAERGLEADAQSVVFGVVADRFGRERPRIEGDAIVGDGDRADFAQ